MLGRGAGQRDPPLGKIIKTLAAGVGLASETYQHQKEKKQLKQQANSEQRGLEEPQSSSVVEASQEEKAWQLDELQDELAQQDIVSGSNSDAAAPSDISALADNFIQTHRPPHQPPPYSDVDRPARLDLPVIITQRRPKDRARGFIRAYAPLLQNVDIDQQSFLDFIDSLNKSVQPSPWIQAINLASFAAQHVPEPVTLAVSVACKMVADAASTVHSRYKTNSFLDKVNDEYFKSKGLIALLVTWKPNDSSMVTDFGSGMGSTISKVSSPGREGTSGKWKHRMQSSSGASSFEFPETAPLVFPALDELTNSTSNNNNNTSDDPAKEAKKQSALKRGGAFLADYQDRRAVAEWAGKNPDSKVANAMPPPEFRSRYSDPNHPASSGDLLAFVSGGKVSGSSLRPSRGLDRGRGRGRGSMLDSAVRGGRRDQMEMLRATRGQAGVVGGVVHGVKGLLQKVSFLFFSRIEDVFVLHSSCADGDNKQCESMLTAFSISQDILYLLVVNRPSEHEIEEAVALVYGNEQVPSRAQQ